MIDVISAMQNMESMASARVGNDAANRSGSGNKNENNQEFKRVFSENTARQETRRKSEPEQKEKTVTEQSRKSRFTSEPDDKPTEPVSEGSSSAAISKPDNGKSLPSGGRDGTSEEQSADSSDTSSHTDGVEQEVDVDESKVPVEAVTTATSAATATTPLSTLSQAVDKTLSTSNNVLSSLPASAVAADHVRAPNLPQGQQVGNENALLKEQAVVAEQPLTKNMQLLRDLIAAPGATTDKQALATAVRPEQFTRNLVSSLTPVKPGAVATAVSTSVEGQGMGMDDNRQTSHSSLFEKFSSILQSSTGLTSKNMAAPLDMKELSTPETKLADSELSMRVPATALRSNPVVQQNLMPTLQLNTHVNNPGWGQDVGEKMLMMVRQDIQQAKLQLNPANLGPVEVKISMGQDQQVNVTFLAQNSAVREALDSASVRLRDMLDSQGMNLGEFNVSQEAFRERRDTYGQGENSEQNQSGFEADSDAGPEIMSVHEITNSGNDNLVDYFA